MKFAKNYGELKDLFDTLPKNVVTNWIIITGPPCSGKTTIINRLASMGYSTNQDITRDILERNLAKGIDPFSSRKNELIFQKKVLVEMVNNSLTLNPKSTIFNDYFLHDNLAFLKLSKLYVPINFKRSIELFKVRKVFICKPLTFVKDKIRTETIDDQLRLYQLLIDNYHSLGYEVIELDAKPVEFRVKMILNELSQIRPITIDKK